MPQARAELTRNTVSIVVPMCNEEESIEILRQKLELLQRRLCPSFSVEYCLVDDGSTDRTWELMPSAVPAGGSTVMCRHIGNRGLGAALRTGIEASSGSIVCTIDADCSYPPENLCQLIDMVVSLSADVVVASPYHPQGGVVGVKPWRILLSRQCSHLYRLLSPLKLYTYTSIFRAYRGPVARRIRFKSDGFLSAVEMLLSAESMGCSIAEVPMVLKARAAGTSKIRIVRTMRAHFGLMLSLVLTGAWGRSAGHSNGQKIFRDGSNQGRISVGVRMRNKKIDVIGEEI